MLPESSANRSEVMEKRQERVREECAKELGGTLETYLAAAELV